MNEILAILSKDLNFKLRRALEIRFDNLMSGIKYRYNTDAPLLRMAIRKGWSLGKIEVVCALNAFYQVILGPLSSSTFADLGTDSPLSRSIKHGNIVITKDNMSQIHDCHITFRQITSELDIDFWSLQANHYDDLIYRLAKPNEEEHE